MEWLIEADGREPQRTVASVLFVFDPRAASLFLGPAALLWIGEKVTVFTHEDMVEESLWECGVCVTGRMGTGLDGFL